MSRGLFPERDLLRALAEKTFGPSKPTPQTSSPATVGMPIGTGDCWCGQSSPHDWPGKADGAPHPRYPR